MLQKIKVKVTLTQKLTLVLQIKLSLYYLNIFKQIRLVQLNKSQGLGL